MQSGKRTLLSLSPYAFLAIALLLFNAGFLWFNFQAIRGHQSSIEHTNEVLHELDLLFSSATDAETGVRGFALTKDVSFLEKYQIGRTEIWQHFNRLRALTQDNPGQQAALNSLEAAISSRLTALQTTHQKYLDQPNINLIDPIFIRTGQTAMRALQMQIEQMKAEENRVLQLRSQRVENSQRDFLISLLGTTALSIFVLGLSLGKIWKNQRKAQEEAEIQASASFQKAKVVELSQILAGPLSLEDVGREVLKFLSQNISFFAGNFFIIQDNNLLKIGSFAEEQDQVELPSKQTKIGDGLIGEAALRDKIWEVSPVPENYFWISSSLGRTQASVLTFRPVRHEERNIGILELAGFSPLSENQKQLMENLLGIIADGLNAAQWRNQIQNLLLKTQQQSEELQTQQEELRASNEELEQQTEELKSQQDELRATNEALEEQARTLERQKEILSKRHREVEEARKILEGKAAELLKANQYKSEFLARMSHELRTPLNSLLILAALLIENREKNLSSRQIEFAQSIYSAGHDLLGLINDILDLSKIDAKKLTLRPEKFTVHSLCEHIQKIFDIQFQSKNINFRIIKDKGVGEKTLWSDRQRIEQILRNFLSNALKFTEAGTVTLRAKPSTKLDWIRWEVEDTGIGIHEDKKELIFEAFEQADSSVSRKYGGTGLGLSISKELSTLLGGFIEVKSTLGKGSSFALEMPLNLPAGAAVSVPIKAETEEVQAPQSQSNPAQLETKRVKKLLVVEDNQRQREAIIQLVAGHDIEISSSKNGEDAFQTIQKFDFDCVILDLELPDITGFDVLERLKSLHIEIPPVVIYTGREITEKEEEKLRRFSESIIIKGARSPERLVEEVNSFLKRESNHLPKPQGIGDLSFQDKSLEGKTVLLVDDDLKNVFALANGLESWGLNVRIGRNGLEGLQILEEYTDVDIVLMDLMMPKMDGYEAIRRIRQYKNFDKLPVVALTAKTAKESREKCLEAGANDYLAKPVQLANLRSVLKVWLVPQKGLS